MATRPVAQVAIVRRVSENDVEEVSRMPYDQAIAELRKMTAKQLRSHDLVYIQHGQLGRYASWSL